MTREQSSPAWLAISGRHGSHPVLCDCLVVLHLLQQCQHEGEGGKANQRNAEPKDLRRQAGCGFWQFLPEDDHEHLQMERVMHVLCMVCTQAVASIVKLLCMHIT